MRDAVICEPLRTPVGGYGGGLRGLQAHQLASAVVCGLLQRTGLPSESVDDVLLGNCYPTMEAPALGRVVALNAGLVIETGGLQIDRRCGSGLQAVVYAAMQVQCGASDVVLAGGAESMSNAPYYTTDARWGVAGPNLLLHDALLRGRTTAGGEGYPVPGGMIETAENLRRQYGISRQEQDEFAVRSHERAAAAIEAGRFVDELVPVEVPGRKGSVTVVDTDEHVRRGSSVEALSRLRPLLAGSDPEATVTAGNASGQNDGASICVVTTLQRAHELGLQPLVRLVAWSGAGVAPSHMGIGPVPAVARTLKAADVALQDVDLIELNEAFASQVLACTREWDFTESDFDRLNVNGSGISLGHPVGATGGRILATLTREMRRRDAHYGLETMCIGGGQGLAALFELVES